MENTDAHCHSFPTENSAIVVGQTTRVVLLTLQNLEEKRFHVVRKIVPLSFLQNQKTNNDLVVALDDTGNSALVISSESKGN